MGAKWDMFEPIEHIHQICSTHNLDIAPQKAFYTLAFTLLHWT